MIVGADALCWIFIMMSISTADVQMQRGFGADYDSDFVRVRRSGIS
jgi:hypothetical protein